MSAIQLANDWTGIDELKTYALLARLRCRKRSKIQPSKLTPGSADTMTDERKTLLGSRFLCVDGGLLFRRAIGVGKSSASVQQDILWLTGREAFGIRPARPLRHSHDKPKTMRETGDTARGVCAGLHLDTEASAAVGDDVLYVSERSHTGSSFLASVVAPLLEKYRPDILRIDPLLAYLGGDVTDANYSGLSPCRFESASGALQLRVIVNHHTPKVVNRDTSAWCLSDYVRRRGQGPISQTGAAPAAPQSLHTPAMSLIHCGRTRRAYRLAGRQ